MVNQGKMMFYCPRCQQKLSMLEGTIIKMVGRLHAPHFSCKTMIYVPAKLGQHGCVVGEGVRLREGALVELECTNGACKANLTTPYNAELAEVMMRDGSGAEFKVIFNKIYGKNSTFVLNLQQKTIVSAYGDAQDSVFSDRDERQRNFFGEGSGPQE